MFNCQLSGWGGALTRGVICFCRVSTSNMAGFNYLCDVSGLGVWTSWARSALTKLRASWGLHPIGSPDIAASFSTKIVNHEYLYIQCYSFVVFMTILSQVQNICKYISLSLYSKLEYWFNIWLSVFLFFSWVESFGHEGLGLLLDILEKLINGKM